MTTPKMEKIGLVAHYSKQGDWAFETAFRLARTGNASLNIFHFLESPYEVPVDTAPSSPSECTYDAKALVEWDRKLREYYEDRLEDFVDVGFRVCENGRHNLELRRCLKRKEYQLLIVPYLDYGVTFGNMPIEEFAYRFNAPLLLVGPEHRDQYLLNLPGSVLDRSVDFMLGDWVPVHKPSEFQNLPVI